MKNVEIFTFFICKNSLNPKALRSECAILGWKVNYEKSSLKPKQEIYVQGFLIDTVQMKFIYPEWKKERLENQIMEVITTKRCSAKELASVYGRLSSATRAFGRLNSITRHGQHRLGQAILDHGKKDKPDWNVHVTMDKQTVE